MEYENEKLEYKKSLTQLKEGVISLSAMLNKHNEGTLVFGVNDDLKVVGLMIGKKTLNDVTQEIRNHLKPLPHRIEVVDDSIDDKRVIKVDVQGNDTPYSAYGRYYTRVNDSDILMDSSVLQRFFEEKEDNYSKWEKTETKYGVDDIDENLLIECVRSANEKGRINYVYKNAKDALLKFGLLTDNEKLNNAGLFLFGNNKPLTIKEANYPTDSRTEFGEIKDFQGNIFECIKEVTSYILNHISYKSEIVGLQREETPEIPIRALREIIVNSFAHSKYFVSGDYNQYIIYKSSIRIYNPGPIIRGIDPLKFASGKVGSKIRNILIASVLYKCGYIDAFGTGFDRTFTLCIDNNIRYEYYSDEFGFTFVFKRKPDFLTANKVKTSKTLKDKIKEMLISNKYINVSEIAKILDKSEITIYRYLQEMVKNGELERVGSRKTGYWSVLD